MARKRKKKNKTIKIFYVIFLLLGLLFSGIIFYLKVLPIKYYTIYIAIYLIINFIILLLIKSKKTNNVIPEIICFMFTCLFIFGLYYLNTTLNFMDKIKGSNYQLNNYYVYVLKDSMYDEIKDLNGKMFGIYETKGINEAKEKLENIITFKNKEYENIINLGKELLNKKTQAIFIDEKTASFIKESVEDFETKTKVVETISIKRKIEETIKNVDITSEPFNIYISGIDVYGNIFSVSRSDVNMIMTVNPKTHKILLTSIPRDYYVRLHNTEGYKDKLTHAGLYGIDMSINTIEDFLKTDINYYVRINFSTLESLVDSIDGVDVLSDYSFTSLHGNYNFKAGINHMNGKQALAFSRERYAYKDGDRQRVKNQQAVLTGIINKLTSSKTIIMKYNDILTSLSDNLQTNMPSNKIYSFVNMQLDKMPKWDIEQISLNGTDSFNYTYSYPSGKLYVMEPDEETIISAVNKIKEVLS